MIRHHLALATNQDNSIKPLTANVGYNRHEYYDTIYGPELPEGYLEMHCDYNNPYFLVY